jgi:hypothetical protein
MTGSHCLPILLYFAKIYWNFLLHKNTYPQAGLATSAFTWLPMNILNKDFIPAELTHHIKLKAGTFVLYIKCLT